MAERPAETDLRALVERVAAVTGADVPAVLRADAPVPDAAPADYYVVGLIGGKDVGKTTLANALAGVELAPPVGHGEGTRNVTAFCHRTLQDAVRRDFADADVVPHGHGGLLRQVLLDLPDVDSRYADHVALTRRALRRMLYPVWVQSVEKYADARPRELLRQVAEGNDPANFVFVLTKADQLVKREGDEAVRELADDYAKRVADALSLPHLPRVYAVAAHGAERFDLDELRGRLGIDRDAGDVEAARARAAARLRSHVAAWLRGQDLDAHATRAARLYEEAAQVVGERAVAPVLERALPHLADDAGFRMAAAEPAAAARVRAWPLVAWVDLAAAPVIALVRQNLLPATSEAASLERHLADAGEPTADNVRGAFATLRAAHPGLADAYAGRHLWEHAAADDAARDLRRRLAASLDARQRALAKRLAPRRWLAPVRWLLTVGVVAWFSVVQPVLAVVLAPEPARRAVDVVTGMAFVLSAQALLTAFGFALVYLVAVWAAVRLAAYRRVERVRRRDFSDATAPGSPAAETLAWAESLLLPLRRRRDDFAALARDAAAVS